MRIILAVGAMEELHSDQGPEFDNQLQAELMKLMRIHKLMSSPYHPPANGRVERLNSRVLQALHEFVLLQPERWDLEVETVQFALRVTPSTVHGLSPFFIAHDREAKMPHDLMTGGAAISRARDFHEFVERRADAFRLANRALERLTE